MKPSRFLPPKNPKKYPSRCSVCGGEPVTEKVVTLVLPETDGTTRIVHGVPAGVCPQCGEQYLRLDVAEALDRILSSPPTRHEEIPVWEFASTA